MALEHFRHIIIQFFISQIISSYAQYIQYAGASFPIPAYVTSYPVQSFAPSPAPVYAQPYPQPASNHQPPTNLPYKTPAKPMGAPASYAQTRPTPAHVPIPANPAASPVYHAATYQTSPHQQPIKATTVTPSLPDPPIVQPIKPAPITKETLLEKPPSLPKDLLSRSSPPFDSNILNNLAIALQLLIVSNLIHNPPPESTPQVIDDDVIPAISPLPIAYLPPNVPEPQSYPNQFIPSANFIGTSSFGETGISKAMMSAYGSPTLSVSRSMGLKSPYDAIANPPYFDSFQSKPEPMSPYHLTSDYKDLFSLTELFKI